MGLAKKKFIVIGLDGATFDIINPLIAEGRLPHLEKIIREGSSGELKSTIPPVTAPAWITFFTGRNPGSHGAYNFRTFDLTKYSSFREGIINTNHFMGDTIFEILSRNDMKVGALGIPMTYPPLKVKGFMVSSGAPRLIIDELSVYPQELLSKIGEFKMPGKFGKENRDYFLRFMEEHFKKHLEISEKMLKEDEYSLFMVVFGNTDWAVHQYWEYIDPNFPTYDKALAEKYGNVIRDQYIAADEAIGKIMKYMDSDTILMIMSDHGAGAYPTRCLNTNTWLMRKGLLEIKKWRSIMFSNQLQKAISQIKNKLSHNIVLMEFIRKILPRNIKENVSSLELNVNNIAWDKTKAYWVPFIPMWDGIVINVKNRQPQGIISEGEEYNQVRDFIKNELLKIKDEESGQPVVSNVFKKEEIYKGIFLENAPDLIVMFNEGYTGGGKISKNLIEAVDDFLLSTNSGFHRLHGIFIAYGSDIQKNKKIKNCEIIDLLSTILYALGMEIPTTIEGKILKDIFAADFIRQHEEKYIRLDEDTTLKERHITHMSEKEQEDMKKHLKGLGYI